MIFPDLDPQAILQALGVTDATAITPVHGGSDTAVLRVEQGAKSFALRIFRAGEHDNCEREKQVMQVALDAGLPVPRVHGEGSWRDHPALLLSWLPGRPVADELRARPWRAWPLGVLFGRMHAAIHALSAPAILLEYPDDWIDWQGPREPALQQRLRSMEHRVDALLHLDYHPFNVVTDGRSITGVLDWTNAGAGDPRADAARTVSILHIDYMGKLSIPERVMRRIFAQGWRTGYQQKGGSLPDMSPFYAWSGAVMERDLAAKREPEDLARIHRWTLRWKQRAGCM